MIDRIFSTVCSRAWGTLGASALILASVLSSQLALAQTSIIPAARNFAWNPGMMSKGGISIRSTVCATLSPSGGDDSTAIQAALDSCPANQVVMLNAGTFNVNSKYLLIHSSITLRGSGAGVTILNKTNGARARTSTVISGTNGILTPVDPGTYSYDAQPIVIVGPQRWPKPDSSTSQNLTADGQQGATSVTIANASGFAAGQFVLLDETSGASWQAVPAGFGCSDNLIATPCPPQVWQGDVLAWNMHYPEQKFQDDNGNSNASGPYDTTPGVPPNAMSWFSRTDRPTIEIKEIASVSGNTITFTSPLSTGYRTSHSAQLTRYTTSGSAGRSVQVTNAGVENLSMYGGADGELRFESAAYSWAKNVEVTQWIGEGVAINNSFRVEVRDSYVHTGSWPMPGGAGYVVSLAAGSSEVLIENNILIDTCKEMVFRSSGAGSVVAYNYADDSFDFDAPKWVEVGLNASHMAGPHHVLFEGNYSQNFDSDYTHGNATYMTVFRNWLSGKRRSFTDTVAAGYGNIRTVGLAYGSWWDSFVGNVLGRPGQMGGWNYTDPSMSCDSFGNNCSGNVTRWADPDIWKIGYDPERWGMVPDPQTLATVIRDGNYDFLTNSQRWHNTPGGFAIPNSMYLTSKPAFFGSNTWPWVDPTTGTISTLPAKARYDAGTPNIVPNQTSFSVAVSASPSNGGTVAGGGTFASGSSDTVTATPNSGSTFVNWTENGTVVSTAASYTFTLAANRNLVANFNVPSNTIALSASPTAGGTVGGSGTFASGTSHTVTATANSGYTFTNWTENGTVVSTGASYTFTLTGNRNLVANFQSLAAQNPAMSTPNPGSALAGTSATFTWTAGTGNSQYWLSMGTTAGGTDLYNSSTDTNLSATVNGLPANGQTLYVRLWWLKAGAWLYADYTYQAANPQKAVLITPAPGSVLPATSSSVTFAWTSGLGVAQYWLAVGVTAGGTEYYNASTGTALSASISVPLNGQQIYVRLWSSISGVWQFSDYTYTAGRGQIGALTTPAPQSVLPGSSATFGWTAGAGATQYWLYVGAKVGSAEYFNASTGTSLSATVNGLPTDGRVLYVRLYSLVSGVWLFNDYQYTSGPGITSPAPQATLSGATVTFNWNAATGATQYWLSVSGTTLGGTELYNQSTGTARSASVGGLPTDGRTIYVRFWYVVGSNWLFSDYLYTASSTQQRPRMTAPAPGLTLAGTSQTFAWSASTGASQYFLSVGTTVGGSDLYNASTGTNLSTTVSNLPVDGRILYARLWFLSGSTWSYNDFIYYAAKGAQS